MNVMLVVNMFNDNDAGVSERDYNNNNNNNNNNNKQTTNRNLNHRIYRMTFLLHL